ncbi:hypothetical protein MRX96_010249 [Rhipicephalus microplus]
MRRSPYLSRSNDDSVTDPPFEAERVSRHTAINVCGCRRGVPPWSWPRGGKKDVACVVTRDVTRSQGRCATGARNEGGQAFLPVPSSSAISISCVVLTGGTRNRMKVPPLRFPVSQGYQTTPSRAARKCRLCLARHKSTPIPESAYRETATYSACLCLQI